jgi:hypothetical protein
VEEALPARNPDGTVCIGTRPVSWTKRRGGRDGETAFVTEKPSKIGPWPDIGFNVGGASRLITAGIVFRPVDSVEKP